MGIDTDATDFAHDPGGPGLSVKNVVEDGLKPQEHPRRCGRTGFMLSRGNDLNIRLKFAHFT